MIDFPMPGITRWQDNTPCPWCDESAQVWGKADWDYLYEHGDVDLSWNEFRATMRS